MGKLRAFIDTFRERVYVLCGARVLRVSQLRKDRPCILAVKVIGQFVRPVDIDQCAIAPCAQCLTILVSDISYLPVIWVSLI